jgi:wee1-like protein kinase
LHRHQIVHLDIKPDNLLFKEGKLKISDLGLCRATRLNKTNYVDEGDSRYLAKEVLNYSK